MSLSNIVNIVLIQWGNLPHLLQNNNVWGNLAQHLDKVVHLHIVVSSPAMEVLHIVFDAMQVFHNLADLHD